MFVPLVTRNHADFHSEMVEAKVVRKRPVSYHRHPAEPNRFRASCKSYNIRVTKKKI